MGMKHFKAYTPSRRNMTVSDFAEITKKTPEKSLFSELFSRYFISIYLCTHKFIN